MLASIYVEGTVTLDEFNQTSNAFRDNASTIENMSQIRI
jgi:hypothetical protein